MVYTENVRFEWDPNKSKSNLAKHGVGFEVAVTAFDDPEAMILDDVKHSTVSESRNWLIGLSDDGVLIVVFTIRQSGKVYRIISARKANSNERRQYEESKGV